MATSRATGNPRGRPPNRKNKATIERELKAEQEIAARVLDKARNGEPVPELGKDVLARMMRLAEGAAAQHRPTSDAEVQAGTKPRGDWEEFGKWFDRTVYAAKELAKYQSPTFRAIAVSQTPDNPGDGAKAVDAEVLSIKDTKVLQITYQKMLKASVGK